MLTAPHPVLICENSPDDIFLTRRIFQRLKLGNPLAAACDGLDAIAYLEGTGKYDNRAQHPFPAAVITDLRMPRADGFAVLQWFLDHPEKSTIPVVVWSSSELPSDIEKAYDLGAHCYLVKQPHIQQWENTIQRLFEFWKVCEFPSRSPG